VQPSAFTGPGRDHDTAWALWEKSQQLAGVHYLNG
jgi:hypothetical protein